MNFKPRPSARPSQVEALVSYIEKHPELSSGKISEELTHSKKKQMWKEIQKIMHAIYPGCQKTPEQWRRTWIDQKASARYKASGRSKQMRNGESATVKLSPLEIRILNLCDTRSNTLLNIETNVLENDNLDQQSASLTNGVCTEIKQEFQAYELSGSCDFSVDSSSTLLVDTQTAQNHMGKKQEDAKQKDTIGSFSISENTISESLLLIKKEPTGEDLSCLVSLATTEPLCPIIISAAPVTSTVTTPIIVSAAPVTTSVSAPIIVSTAPVMPSISSHHTVSSNSRAYKTTFRRRRHMHTTAEKAAETFTNIAERNCVVLERLATAMETQAAEAAKQTKLMEKMINILSKR